MSKSTTSYVKGIPFSLPNHYDSYGVSTFKRNTIDGKLFAFRVTLKQGSETELEIAESGPILMEDEFNCLYSDAFEKSLFADQIGKKKFRIDTIRKVEEIKNLMWRIIKIQDINKIKFDNLTYPWSRDLVVHNKDKEDFVSDIIKSINLNEIYDELLFKNKENSENPGCLSDSITRIFTREECLADLCLFNENEANLSQVYEIYPIIFLRDFIEKGDLTSQMKWAVNYSNALEWLLIEIVNKKIDIIIKCFDYKFEELRVKLMDLIKDGIYKHFTVCSRITETKYKHLFEEEDKGSFQDILINLVKLIKEFMASPLYDDDDDNNNNNNSNNNNKTIKEISAEIAEACAESVVVYEMHDPRLSYILNYDGENNVNVDVYTPQMYENIRNHVILSYFSKEEKKKEKSLEQFLNENKLFSLKDLIAILEHDLFVAKNRTALHLVKEIEICLINIYNNNNLYGDKDFQINQDNENCKRNAEKTGYLLGGGRTLVFGDEPLLLNNNNNIQRIIKETVSCVVNDYLFSDKERNNKIVKLNETLTLIVKNYYTGLLNQRDYDNKDEYLNVRWQETGWLYSRFKEEGEKHDDNDYRDNCCSFCFSLLFYMKNKQFPGFFYFKDLANNHHTSIDWLSYLESHPLSEFSLEEIIQGKDLPLSSFTSEKLFHYLGIGCLQFRYLKFRHKNSRVVRKENDPSDYVTVLSPFSPYSPVINCVELKRIPVCVESFIPASKGHYNFIRFNWRLDNKRFDLKQGNWFIINNEELYGTKLLSPYFNLQELPRLCRVNPNSDIYFLTGENDMKEMYKRTILSGNIVLQVKDNSFNDKKLDCSENHEKKE